MVGRQTAAVLQKNAASLKKNTQIIVDTVYSFVEAMKAVGKEFANSVKNNFQSSLSTLLKFTEDDPFGTFFKSILNNFTGGIIDAFSKGITEKLFSTDIMSSLTGLATNVFKSGSGSGSESAIDVLDKASGISNSFLDDIGSELSNLTDGLDFIFSSSVDVLTGLFSSLASGLSSLFSSIGGSGGGGFLDGILSIFGFADGGLFSGIGTGRSDSNLAAISNGEFIVNAAQTKRFLPLLNWINTPGSSLQSFADGGQMTAKPVSVAAKSVWPQEGSGSNQTNISLGITGDISRQTRKEVMNMLPIIANSIASYNREKGIKR